MVRKEKKVPHPTKLDFSKDVRIPDDPWRGHPIWLFCCFDNALPFPDGNNDYNHSFNDLGERLKQYESRTWAQILADGERDHFINIDNLEKFARTRLTTLRLDDEDHQEILRLRFSAKNRLWGYKEGNAFKVLWWDPHHEICPSTKKHT